MAQRESPKLRGPKHRDRGGKWACRLGLTARRPGSEQSRRTPLPGVRAADGAGQRLEAPRAAPARRRPSPGDPRPGGGRRAPPGPRTAPLRDNGPPPPPPGREIQRHGSAAPRAARRRESRGGGGRGLERTAVAAGARGPLRPPPQALPSAPPRRQRRECTPAAPPPPASREGLHTKRCGTPTSARGGDGSTRRDRRRPAAPTQPAPLGGRGPGAARGSPSPDSPTAPCPSSWRNLKRLGRLAVPLSVGRFCRESARPPTG